MKKDQLQTKGDEISPISGVPFSIWIEERRTFFRPEITYRDGHHSVHLYSGDNFSIPYLRYVVESENSAIVAQLFFRACYYLTSLTEEALQTLELCCRRYMYAHNKDSKVDALLPVLDFMLTGLNGLICWLDSQPTRSFFPR